MVENEQSLSQDGKFSRVPKTGPKEPVKSRKSEFFEGIFSLLGIVVSSFVLAFLMFTFVFRTYNVNGSSMRPTLSDGDRLIVNKFTKAKAGGDYTPERGQIVVFDSVLEGKSLIKRVIALPGEKVSMSEGRFKVKNEKYPDGFDPDASYEDRLPQNDSTSFEEETVPAGHLFVSGDNRAPGQSLDSRNQLGFVPISEVVGTASIRYFPVSESGRVR